MALLKQVYGDEFAEEMKNKKYDYLHELKLRPPPPPSPPTPEEIERAQKLKEEILESFTKTITIGNLVISTKCYESYPCQHYCNYKLTWGTDIYKMIENTGLLNDETLTKEQKNSIKHFQCYQNKNPEILNNFSLDDNNDETNSKKKNV
jgi:hypothetical protein